MKTKQQLRSRLARRCRFVFVEKNHIMIALLLQGECKFRLQNGYKAAKFVAEN
jgi:hypothetical protein